MRKAYFGAYFSVIFVFLLVVVFSDFYGLKHLHPFTRIIQSATCGFVVIGTLVNRKYIIKRSNIYRLLFPVLLFLSYTNAREAFDVGFLEWITSNSYYLFFYLLVFFEGLSKDVLLRVAKLYYFFYVLLSLLIGLESFRSSFLYIPEGLPPAEAFIPGIQIFIAISVYMMLNTRGITSVTIIVVTLLVTIHTGNRASLFSLILVYITFLSWKVSFRYFLMLSLLFLGILLIGLTGLGKETVDNLSDTDYPRIAAVLYFYNDYYQSALDWLVGFGLGNPSNSLGILQSNLRDIGIYHSDLGVLGTLFQLGFLGSVFLYGAVFSGPNTNFKILIVVYVVSGFTMHYMLSGLSFLFMSFVILLNSIQYESISIPKD